MATVLGWVVNWRDFEERQAIGGRVLRILALLAPSGPKPLFDIVGPSQMPARRARVSVVIPCYNYGHFLPSAVASAVEQVGVDVEVIIVDDCSLDGSREVARRLAADHPQVRAEANAENSGHVRSFNAGWERSRGEYVVKLDADDLLAPGALARAVAVFEAYPSVGLVYGHPRHFCSAEPPVGRTHQLRWTVWRGRDWLAERCRLGVSAITNPEMVLRSSILRVYGAMDPAVAYAPDMEISLRIAAVSDIAHIGGADQALHREHSASMSETDGSGIVTDLRARAAAFSRAFDSAGDQLDSEELALRDQARMALARDALRSASADIDKGRKGTRVPLLLEFARDIFPISSTWSSFRRIDRAYHSGGAGALGAAGRRIARRVRYQVYRIRWLVKGI